MVYQVLVESHCDVDAADNNNDTAVTMAVKNRDGETLRVCIVIVISPKVTCMCLKSVNLKLLVL